MSPWWRTCGDLFQMLELPLVDVICRWRFWSWVYGRPEPGRTNLQICHNLNTDECYWESTRTKRWCNWGCSDKVPVRCNSERSAKTKG